jgi:hypothetical protein
MNLAKYVTLLGFTTSFLSAATISFISGDGLNESNSRPGNTNVLITPHPAWQPNNPNGSGAKWITYTGGGNPSNVPNPITGPTPNDPTAIFYETFTVLGTPTSGTLLVWADDTARVLLNGTMLFEANPSQGGNCTSSPIGCRPENGATINLTTALKTGLNTLQFDVYQRFGGPSGLLYAGTATTENTNPTSDQVPEPTTIGLVGAALLGAGLYRRRR